MRTMLKFTCQICGNGFERRKGGEGPNPIYCSKSCHARGSCAGWNKAKKVRCVCEVCKKVVMYLPDRASYFRTCSKECLGRLQSRERVGVFGLGKSNPMWKDGINSYRRFRKSKCERCGSARFLVVHHKDENRRNNEPENLETLCKRCHQIEHDCLSNLLRGSDRP